MPKPALRIVCGQREQRLTQRFFERFPPACPDSAQLGLPFGKRFFNGREVGRIAWQQEQLASSGLNQLLHLLAFLSSQINHDHDLAFGQAGCQDLFHRQLESGGSGCSLDDHGLSHAGPAKSRKQGGIFAPIAWHPAIGTRSLWSTRIQGSQSEIGATLIENDELAGVQLLEVCSPGGSGLFVAFSATQRLFFRVQPTRLIARLMVDVLTATPCCSSHS
jgi:hypothetical protein